MRPRLSLNDLLLTYCPNVYYQPPDSIKMRYPCIVYNRRNDAVRHADGLKYTKYNAYDLTVIDKNPESTIAEALSDLKYCSFDRQFASANLNHFVYRLYW